jgi:hypothetical protein
LGPQVLLFADLATLARFFYIFLLKNPGNFNDDFWAFFLNLWVKLATLVSMTAYHCLLTIQPINFYICSGLNPTVAFQNTQRQEKHLTMETLLKWMAQYG